ncbi:MAG: hypothetical protein JW902_02730 [Syntrophaceae bacterium]|nr:hypothetical protein [Syntrophaceae bacterium]
MDTRSFFLFDRQDYELLKLVNLIIEDINKAGHLASLFDPALHPHGIKELAASREVRIAHAVMRLLGSLEVGKGSDRIEALRSLHDEVLSASPGHMPRNTARALLQIMKELVRGHGDTHRQLKLAHDFRLTASGKPRLVRAQLEKYHLIEMPERWNQLAFDDHVHDASTKGRKTPTHLIMDAWIKGIREITVIYYNHVRSETAAELLEAAEIMSLKVRIGVSLIARFRNRYVHFIWTPRGFSDAQDFLAFLKSEKMVDLFAEGKEVSCYQQQYVLKVLDRFNSTHRIAIKEKYGVSIPQLSREEFLAFVGYGQVSLLHLGEFIYSYLEPLLVEKMAELRARYHKSAAEEKKQIEEYAAKLQHFDSEAIVEQYLRPLHNPSLPNPNQPREQADMPAMLSQSPEVLLSRLRNIHSGCRITLNLTGLQVEDILELLYDCRGMITHLELFNLKDFDSGKTPDLKSITDVMTAVNDGDVIGLKRIIKHLITRAEGSETDDRVETFRKILHDIDGLRGAYRRTPLKARIGSDSTGRSRHLHGMGFAVLDTLPYSAQRKLRREKGTAGRRIPVKIRSFLRITQIPTGDPSERKMRWARLVRKFLLPGFKREETWIADKQEVSFGSPGNLITLGGFRTEIDPPLFLVPPDTVSSRRLKWAYLNTGLKNGLKVTLGFTPAFLTFLLTKEWWLLGYFGAVIWFAITGFRNILQSVLGGGGVRRSHLLRWNDYVSWERICDSLFFTGFSVPLLDYVVKTLLFDRGFGITTATAPVILYTGIALSNGLYLSSHNLLRGLPRAAVVGNFFRSVLSIPVALTVNAAVGGLLVVAGVSGVDIILQKWAAIVSKGASDCVAGFIEGLADRAVNIQIRIKDYRTKLRQVFEAFSRIELHFPDDDILQLMESPEKFIYRLESHEKRLKRVVIINALDMLYFWMYQPRARSALSILLRGIGREELLIFLRSQLVLGLQREISILFIDGMAGENFSRPLAFFLDRSAPYLKGLEDLVKNCSSAEAIVSLTPGASLIDT